MTKRQSIFLRATLLVVIVWSFHKFGFLYWPEKAGRFVISSLSGLIYKEAITVRNWFSREKFSQKCDLADNNEKTAELVALTSKFALVNEENISLRALLNFSTSSLYTLVGAEVIGRSIDPLGTTMIINQGDRSQVEIGDPVVSGNGLLIGIIVRADERSSVVRLINDSRSRIAAMVANGTKSQGLVEGGYGLSVKMNFIPQHELIKPGDLVVSSGLEGTIPRGLNIGAIEVVEKKSQEPFQQAILKPSADLSSLLAVSIVRYRP